jgi:hypothetical protein
MKTDDIFTAAGFLTERRDFLYVYAAPSVSGDGFDVVMRVDGTYSDEAGAEEAAKGIRESIERLKDVPAEGHTWWIGPPWQRL